MDYQDRILDDTLDEVLSGIVAVALEGAKGVGKTATASRRAKTILTLTDPQMRAAVHSNYDLVADAEPPVFVDEWQLEAQVWDRIRTAVDQNPGAAGRFILAGSAGAPPDARIHSGAGRIIRLTMRPMSLIERGIQEPSISLRNLFTGDAEIEGNTEVALPDYVEEILRSGFPGIRNLEGKNRDRQLDGYIARIVDKDLAENGVAVRRPAAMLAWLRAYGAATSSTTDYTKILNAATAGESNKPARATVDSYREHLTRLFILDPVEAWTPSGFPLARLTVSPKHHLVDPALAARMAGIGSKGLLHGDGFGPSLTAGTWLGALFESLAVQSVRIYSDAMNARIGHLRTKQGDREIDIVVEANDTSLVALEVKLAAAVDDEDVKHLLWLQKTVGARLRDAVILNTGKFAYRRKDGIAVVPLALIGP
ncbi:MAG: ATP-binding protein [Cryobacterium sp.]|nr:ATP-binding protein [Cryobacterium sp.]